MRHLIFIVLLFFVSVANAAGERIKLVSDFTPEITLDRFVQALEREGVPILNEDEGMGSANEVKFANPLFGANIGLCGKGLRKDKPMKVVVWKDDNGTSWLSYESPRDIVNNFGVIECGHETDNLRRTLKGFVTTATEN
ncbi:MAG: hypothetical protein OEY11_15400, partial [Gammaproteobacteria bacterium]|nr:hypothetical protein [Gammaproteobacteria bacterium]